MLRLSDIRLPLNHTDDDLRSAVAKHLSISPAQIQALHVFRRNYDARKKSAIVFSYTIDVELFQENNPFLNNSNLPKNVRPTPDMTYRFVAYAPKTPFQRPIIIGCGPCGTFAALILAQSGFKPIIVERGKPVRERSKDTFDFWRKRQLNTESNVQFGEGGAGTFSDGKLHSLIRDPHHYARKVLQEYVNAGAPEDILTIGKPHIGTFKLVKIAETLREKIIALGGTYLFESRVDDLILENNAIKGIVLHNGQQLFSDHVILAIGHSARETFTLLHQKGIAMQAKAFSIGFRIEHPQSLINQCRMGQTNNHPLLGAADYKLFHHCKNGRTVYSFCMCPGGTVVAAASQHNRLVTNGMSQYSRNERNANAAIVVDVSPDDYPGDALAGMHLQEKLEEKAFVLGGSNYNAPCQLVSDFLAGRPGHQLGSLKPSYQPGVTPSDLSQALPDFAIEAIKEALPVFNQKIPGFTSKDAVLTGTETRTSSPVRLLRDATTLESINTKGLYPAGEGAGYAGGILSSAIDGIKAAQAVALAIALPHQKN